MSLDQSTARYTTVIVSLFTLSACVASATSLTWKAGSSRKIEQVTGPCDWVTWDPKSYPVYDPMLREWFYGKSGSCGQTASQAFPNEVLGHDLGFSFEDTVHPGNLIFLFGDTIGVKSGVTLDPNPKKGQFLKFNAEDAMASSTTRTAAEQFSLNEAGNSPPNPLFVASPSAGISALPPQPDGMQPANVPNGTPVSMGPDDVPNSGISLSGPVNGTTAHTFILVNTGANMNDPSGDPHFHAWSVLVSFDGVNTFTSGRTISQSHYQVGCPVCAPALVPGHFVFTAVSELPLLLARQWLGVNEPVVLIYGNGQFRKSSLYLSYIPESEFWTGLDQNGNPATRYFKGLHNGMPTWSDQESDAVPVVYDNPTGLPTSPDPGTIGNASVYYDKDNTGLWMITWDGGRQVNANTGTNAGTEGIYFTSATAPWGHWTAPQLIYNPCAAHAWGQGYGDFLFYYYGRKNGDGCSAAFPNLPAIANQSGPAGPVIGTNLDPFGYSAWTERGAPYAPEIIGRLTEVSPDGKTLKLFYLMSTWNPYTAVQMESDFRIQ